MATLQASQWPDDRYGPSPSSSSLSPFVLTGYDSPARIYELDAIALAMIALFALTAPKFLVAYRADFALLVLM